MVIVVVHIDSEVRRRVGHEAIMRSVSWRTHGQLVRRCGVRMSVRVVVVVVMGVVDEGAVVERLLEG
jgi:hypothetical protein